MKCDKCKLEFVKAEDGGDTIGIEMTLEANITRSKKKIYLAICFECWVESFGVKVSDVYVKNLKE